MFNFLKKFFDYNQREVERYKKKVVEINLLEDKARKLVDKDFVKETEKLKDTVQSDPASIEGILPWSFALVREAARRVLGQRHFDVQLMAGLGLHEGKITEQKTGEGKTLSATTALYLNALVGKGAHLVTVNDYLARRDAGWMGGVFHLLGLSTSAIISDKSFLYDQSYVDDQAQDWRLLHLKQISRKEAYKADVTYGINSEFGFDYLRDNMASNLGDLVQRGFYYAIIDESDSVLVDEARTPHIISAPYEEDTTKYYKYAQMVKQLSSKTDFVIDEKLRTANLNEEGIKKIETMLGVANIYEKDYETLFHIEAALKAQTLFRQDKDYIVKDNEVIIVDEFTGRLLYGRRFSEGIHQAIEAKENVSIQKESKTLATVSLQNYFRMYKKLAGMTGTASTEAEEFHKIYKTDVIVIPTHLPMVRKDYSDMIYKTEKGKFQAIVEDIANNYKNGRPVLVGTTSIEKNEYLSRLLKGRGIPHELLNAKNHEREAMIISNAGKKGSITVATNMAGRGVDIVLGGETPSKFKVQSSKFKVDKEYEKNIKQWQERHDEVVGLGGLYVIGTERHESRRIDNQLRGRSGRQGDPGESRFFVSLADDLMRIFGGDQIAKLMTFFNFPEDQPLTHSMVSKAIEQAQVKVEGFNFDIRKHLVEYDDVLNKQREIIYSLRRNVLVQSERNEKKFKEIVHETYKEEILQLVNAHISLEQSVAKDQIEMFLKELNFILPIQQPEIHPAIKSRDAERLVDYILEKVAKEYTAKEKTLGSRLWSDIVRAIYLSTIDKFWTDHLTSIEDLREGINLRGYAQMDPLVEYKNEAFSMFERLVGDINFEVTRRLFKIEVQTGHAPSVQQEKPKEQPLVFKSASSVDPFSQAAKQREASPPPLHLPTLNQNVTNQQPRTDNLQPINDDQQGFRLTLPGQSQKKPGRNDPCWCGSGKKYKKCHYPN